jgi:hypothetical protein
MRTFGEPLGPLTGISPKHIDLVHFGQFSMVLITDLGPRVDSNVLGTLRSSYRNLAKIRRFFPFWRFSIVLLTDFGPRAIRTFGEHRGPITGISPKLIDLVYSGSFLWF